MDAPLGSADDIQPSATVATYEDTVCDLGTVWFASKKVVFSWTVWDYNSWPQGVDEVKSPKFRHSNSSEWCLVLCKDVAKSLFLCFRLLSSHKGATVRATVTASLVSNTGERYEVYPPESVCLHEPRKSPWKCLAGTFDPENGLENVLTFVGEVNVPSVITEPYHSVALQSPKRTITEDMAALLESGQMTDVSLCAGDEQLEAHRVVLTARSPVFAAMLRHDTRETRTGSIHVEDIEPDVLREVLRFVYTDSTPLLAEMADRLLVAADKYDLPQLKELCEVELARNLTVDNAAATAILALSHSCNVLVPTVVGFVKRHLVHIMGSDGWVTAVRNYAEFVVELSRLVAE